MATPRTFRFSFSVALAACALVACAPDNHEDDADADAGEWTPLPSDCANYETTWTSYDLGGITDAGVAADVCAHVLDVPRVAYINKVPPHGSTSFPVGTMIIKQIQMTPDPSTWQIFAMAKRGGDYDPGSGCVGWEWYGIDPPDDAGSCRFQWSGTQPTGSEAYASCGPCANCHSAAQTNDCVIAPELSLSQW